ncbi:MAG: hypothetical protein DRP78_00355 [Candidatus Omnitrophota bacterium]|nr:MAG: hypothetical protein DRP78_00355 [Candidatus Omnitrophota bacterium]
MKIGVISDTHIPVNCEKLPEQIAKCFKGVDMILHAGDLIEVSVLTDLAKITNNVIAVAGNMDLPCVRTKLPQKRIISAGKYKIGLIHGWGSYENLPEQICNEFKNDVDIVVFGHSHLAYNEKIGRRLFFNPGSATDKFFSPYVSVGILELTDKINAAIIKL